jgi:MFS family permease
MVQVSARRHHISRRKRAPIMRVLPGLMLVMLLGALDQTIMAPALPAVAGDLGGLNQIPVVVTAYLAAATVVMPAYGKLGDCFGRPRVLLVAIGVFMAGAILCGIAQSMTALVIARTIQGSGGGGLMIGAQAVLGEVVSPRERGRYLALLSGVYILAAVGGPLLGGLVVDHLSWRWIFAGYPPLGLLALIMVRRTLRLPVPQARPPIDYAGAMSLAIAVLCVVLLASIAGGVGQPPGWAVPMLIILAVAAAAAWLLTARRAADPILPLRLFRDRSFAIPTAVSFLIGFALFGTISYLPSYLQIATGASSTRAGLLVSCLLAGVIITLIISGQLISRTGRYPDLSDRGYRPGDRRLGVARHRRSGHAHTSDARVLAPGRLRDRADHAGDDDGCAERRTARRPRHCHLRGDFLAPDRCGRGCRRRRRDDHAALHRGTSRGRHRSASRRSGRAVGRPYPRAAR